MTLATKYPNPQLLTCNLNARSSNLDLHTVYPGHGERVVQAGSYTCIRGLCASENRISFYASVNDSSGFPFLVDGNTGSPILSHGLTPLAISFDGRILYFYSTDTPGETYLRSYDTSSGTTFTAAAPCAFASGAVDTLRIYTPILPDGTLGTPILFQIAQDRTDGHYASTLNAFSVSDLSPLYSVAMATSDPELGSDVAFSADGTYGYYSIDLAGPFSTATQDNNAVVQFLLSDGSISATCPITGNPDCLVISPDGSRLYTGGESNDGTTHLFTVDTASMSVLHDDIVDSRAIESGGNAHPLYSLAISADGNTLYLGGPGTSYSTVSRTTSPEFLQGVILVGNPTLTTTTGGGGTSSTEAGACLAIDAHRRPLATVGSMSPGGSLTASVSNDAGHMFLSTMIDTDGMDPSLLVDLRANRFHIVYAKVVSSVSALYLASGSITDAYALDAGSPSALAGFSGGSLAIAAQHPTDQDYALMVYANGSSIDSASSQNGGATWAGIGSVASADLSSTGRPALCFLGERTFLVYATGTALTCLVSLDRGLTWGSSTPVASSGPYMSLSLLGWQGILYLLAFTGSSSPVPVLFVSSDLGATWSVSGGTLPAIMPPTALGIIPFSGQLRLGTTHNSSDDGAHWISD